MPRVVRPADTMAAMTEMWRVLPNWLTILRLVLAGVFFVVLNLYRFGQDAPLWILPAAIVVFICAAVTDILDGYLARRWRIESTFGRIMDPFCDKVLILGAMVYLAGPRFVDPQVVGGDTIFADVLPGNMISGLYPWMVVVMLGRELLVTSVRGQVESHGEKFGAVWAGKLKMILQSIIIPVVLAMVFILDNYLSTRGNIGLSVVYVRNVLVYATVLVTVFSGLPYLIAASTALGPGDGQ